MNTTASQIAQWTQGQLEGPDLPIDGLDFLDLATATQLTFVGSAFYAKKLAESKACGALVNIGLAVNRRPDQVIIWVKNADVAVAQVLEKLAPPLPIPELGIHPTALIDPTAQIGPDVRIGPHVVVQAHAVIGERVILMANTFIGANSTLGPDCFLWPNVIIRDHCTLGARVICHPGVVVGADGFGYRFHQGRHLKLPHIGTVEIGDDCELGANTTVDRGKFSATRIGAGSKLDNLVQIGHNVRLGKHCVLCAHTAIGGSAQTGDYLVTGGAAAIADHLKLGMAVQLAAMSALDRDAPDGSKWAGTPAKPAKEWFVEYRAQHHVPQLLKTVKELQERIEKLESSAKNH